MGFLSPIFKPSSPRQKILVSPGYGGGFVTEVLMKAGWPEIYGTSPHINALAAWMMTYQPFIDYLDTPIGRVSPVSAAMEQRYVEQVKERFSELEKFWTSHSLHQLKVVEVDGSFMIMNYDGDERIIMVRDQETIILPWKGVDCCTIA